MHRQPPRSRFAALPLLLFLLLLFPAQGAAQTAQAQDEPVPVKLPCAWTVGTHYELVLLKGRRDFADGKKTSDAYSTSRIDVEVIESTDLGYVFRWTVRLIELPETLQANPIAQKLTTQISKVIEGLSLELETDEFGNVLAIRNVGEARETLEKAFAVLRQTLLDEGIPGKIVAEILDPARTSMLSDSLDVTMIKNPRIYFFLSGGTFAQGRTLSYDDTLPSPFTGEPIPSKGAISLWSVDDETQRATVHWGQHIDADVAHEIMLEFSRRNFPDPDKRLELPANMTLDVRDTSTFEYSLSDGIAREVNWSRSVTVGNRKRVDWLKFTTDGPR